MTPRLRQDQTKTKTKTRTQQALTRPKQTVNFEFASLNTTPFLARESTSRQVNKRMQTCVRLYFMVMYPCTCACTSYVMRVALESVPEKASPLSPRSSPCVSDLHQHFFVPQHLGRPQPHHADGHGRIRLAPLAVLVVGPVMHQEVFEGVRWEHLLSFRGVTGKTTCYICTPPGTGILTIFQGLFRCLFATSFPSLLVYVVVVLFFCRSQAHGSTSERRSYQTTSTLTRQQCYNNQKNRFKPRVRECNKRRKLRRRVKNGS